MGGESKRPDIDSGGEAPAVQEQEIVLELMLEWANEDLVRDRIEAIASRFLKGREQVDFNLRAITSVPGPFHENTTSHILQRNIGRWLRANARPSGISTDAFFLNVAGYPITFRVDIEERKSSPLLTFRAIGG